MNLKGTVSSLPNAKGDLYVQMGILRSLVNIRDLEMVEEASITGPGLSGTHTGGSRGSGSGSSKIKMSKSFSVSPEVNLIGMTVDEAIPVLDKYLDDAYLAASSAGPRRTWSWNRRFESRRTPPLEEIKLCQGIPAWRVWRRRYRRYNRDI